MEVTPGGQVHVPEVVRVTVVAHAVAVNNSQPAAAIAQKASLTGGRRFRGNRVLSFTMMSFGFIYELRITAALSPIKVPSDPFRRLLLLSYCFFAPRRQQGRQGWGTNDLFSCLDQVLLYFIGSPIGHGSNKNLNVLA